MSTFPFPWRLLGELLLEKNLIGRERLDEALAEQRRSGRRLGEILVERGALTAGHLTALLSEQYGINLASSPPTKTEVPAVDEWQPLGRLLVSFGVIPERTLDAALATQRATGRRLGEVLVGDHGVSMLALAAALSAQHGVAVGGGDGATAASDSSYEVAEPQGDTLFTTDSFLEATDFAFEYVDAQAPQALQIFRVHQGESAPVWAYDRSAVGQDEVDLVQVYGFRPSSWSGPPPHAAQPAS